MKAISLKKLVLFLSLSLIAISCTEPYEMKTSTFENAIVVEATITNEFKKQQIKISRTYRFEDSGPTFESGATVYVVDSDGLQYPFTEQNNIYESDQEFQAVPGKEYQLFITTSNGEQYSSTNQKLSTINPIQDVTAAAETIQGVRGVNIKVHSFDPTATSKYYRYEYEETYQIIAPKWSQMKMVWASPTSLNYVPRTTEARVCYSTKNSTDIVLHNTVGQSEDRIDESVRFISQQNYIIMNRYSILVRQYIQNLESYNYYKTLRQISGGGGLLSPNQPGFLTGNLKSLTNPKEKVIGFFDVSSVSTKRIFFNYPEVFPNELQPPYFMDCEDRIAKFCFNYQTDPECKGDIILTWALVGDPIFFTAEDQYLHLVPVQCGDCTSFSSNVIPPFWQ